MAFRTEDGVGPPKEWKIALANDGAVAIYDQRDRQIMVFQSGALEAGYWLMALINDGLGVGEDEPDPQSPEGK